MLSKFSNLDFVLLQLCVLQLFVATNSRTSSMWKLSPDETKIESGSFDTSESLSSSSHAVDDDTIYGILTSTVYHGGQAWIRRSDESACVDCESVQTFKHRNDLLKKKYVEKAEKPFRDVLNDDEVLDCGKPVNYTFYDHLSGLVNRNRHPNVPEPQLALLFNTKRGSNGGAFSKEYEVDLLEKKLKKIKREKPKSVQLYNQIGNFWRIKGDSQKAIECFRRALAVTPHNSEVLLNLARVLYTLHYLDEALYLIKKSLEAHSSDKGPWQQHFTLGEIFKAFGKPYEAMDHLQLALNIKPGFEPARLILKEIAGMPANTMNAYTLLIIMLLVIVVLFVLGYNSSPRIEVRVYEIVKPRRYLSRVY